MQHLTSWAWKLCTGSLSESTFLAKYLLLVFGKTKERQPGPSVGSNLTDLSLTCPGQRQKRGAAHKAAAHRLEPGSEVRWPWAFQDPNRLAPSEHQPIQPLKWVVNSPTPKRHHGF